ncbi:putative nuclease HARBI1 [Prorops nasuta]|uniref:putative nuclease HARBI1 n=1 Tax=Prorops nasuta TaxID=863751 RepID=UPI0034CD0368
MLDLLKWLEWSWINKYLSGARVTSMNTALRDKYAIFEYAFNDISSDDTDEDDDFDLKLLLKLRSNQNKILNNHYIEIVAEYSNEKIFFEILLILTLTFINIPGTYQELIYAWTFEKSFLLDFFQSHFRMNKDTANILINIYENSEYCSKRKTAKTATEDILTFLWFAGNKDSMRGVVELFGCSIKTVFQRNLRVMNYLVSRAKHIIKFLRNLQERSERFKEREFPGVIDCVDGTYINMRNPAHKNRSTYVNRHDLVSMLLQAICDENKKFLDVFTGVSSKIHDARAFKLSNISDTFSRICSNEYHILGDSAYPLRSYLLVPFKDYGNLTQNQRKYNKKHSQTRIKIENAFGPLKGRFRQLTQLDMHKIIKLSDFVAGCCVLHNLCIDCNELFENEHESTENIVNEYETHDEIVFERGRLKRNFIMEKLCRND